MAYPILTKLVDAQAMHRQHPDTFEVPSAHELATIVPGMFVKVSRNNERFWIEVVGGIGKYLIGTVGNPLVNEANDDIAFGMPVRVERRHIYSIMKPPSIS